MVMDIGSDSVTVQRMASIVELNDAFGVSKELHSFDNDDAYFLSKTAEIIGHSDILSVIAIVPTPFSREDEDFTTGYVAVSNSKLIIVCKFVFLRLFLASDHPADNRCRDTWTCISWKYGAWTILRQAVQHLC